MEAKTGQWTFDTSDEIFRNVEYFDTKEQAIEYGKNYEGDGVEFYVGQIQKVDYAITTDVDGVLENVAQSVYDEVGEVAEDYLDYVKPDHVQALQEEMDKVLHQWMVQYGYEPTFFKVDNIERISNGS